MKNKILKNIVYSLLEFIIGPASAIIIAPIFIGRVGIEIFGLWVIAITIANMNQILSLGASLGLISFVAENHEKPNEHFSILLGRAVITVVVINYVILIFFVFLFYDYIVNILFKSNWSADVMKYTIMYSLVHLIIQELDAILSSQLKGRGYFALNSNLEVITKLLWLILVIAAAYVEPNIYSIFICSFIGLIIKLTVKAIACTKKCGGKNILIPTMNKLAIVKILNFGRWQCLQIIGGILFGTIDRIMVNSYYGILTMTQYSLCVQFSQSLHSAQSAAWLPLYHWLSIKKKILNKNMYVLMRIAIFGGIFSMVLPLMAAAFSEIILSKWISTEFANSSNKLFLTVVIGSALVSFTIPSHYVLMANGLFKQCSMIVLIGGSLTIVIQFLLVHQSIAIFALGKYSFFVAIMLYLLALNKHVEIKYHKGGVKC